MENFTPVSALMGGALIGLGGLVLLIGSGRLAGISGIARQALFVKSGRTWRLAFIAGLLLGPLLLASFVSGFHYETPEFSWLLLLAGLLVGLGTGWGNGCTSGHGICGLSRLSKRSIIATLVFMFTAMAVATSLA